MIKDWNYPDPTTLEYFTFFGVVVLLFVGVYLFGKYILPKLNKARKLAPKPRDPPQP